MALKQMTLTCDHCFFEDDEEYRSEEEALESGWFVLRGPERELGFRGERVYCGKDCLEADL